MRDNAEATEDPIQVSGHRLRDPNGWQKTIGVKRSHAETAKECHFLSNVQPIQQRRAFQCGSCYVFFCKPFKTLKHACDINDTGTHRYHVRNSLHFDLQFAP